MARKTKSQFYHTPRSESLNGAALRMAARRAAARHAPARFLSGAEDDAAILKMPKIAPSAASNSHLKLELCQRRKKSTSTSSTKPNTLRPASPCCSIFSLPGISRSRARAAPGARNSRSKSEPFTAWLSPLSLNPNSPAADYAVCKLEVSTGPIRVVATSPALPSQQWHWDLIIRMPDFVDAALLKAARAKLEAKQVPHAAEVDFQTLPRGPLRSDAPPRAVRSRAGDHRKRCAPGAVAAGCRVRRHAPRDLSLRPGVAWRRRNCARFCASRFAKRKRPDSRAPCDQRAAAPAWIRGAAL